MQAQNIQIRTADHIIERCPSFHPLKGTDPNDVEQDPKVEDWPHLLLLRMKLV